jgi:hypothetical protein
MKGLSITFQPNYITVRLFLSQRPAFLRTNSLSFSETEVLADIAIGIANQIGVD